MPHHPNYITSHRKLINSNRPSRDPGPSARADPGGVSARSFRADRSTTRRYSHLPACLPLSSEIARAWAACARAQGHLLLCTPAAAYFRNNRPWHPGQGCPPGLATRRVHQRLTDRSAVGRTNYHQQRALVQPLRSCLSPIQLSGCSGEHRDTDPALRLSLRIANDKKKHRYHSARKGQKTKKKNPEG